MLQQIKTEVIKNHAARIILAIEAGSHYWRNLVYFLESQQIPFRLVSPFTLKEVEKVRI